MLMSPRLVRHRIPISLALVCAMLVLAGCGSTSKTSSASRIASNLAAAGIRFASCMRTHGVPNYPDPTISGRGISFDFKSTSGIDPTSPAYQSAQNSCGKLVSAAAPASAKLSAATKTQMLAIAECMRARGINGFPDPTTAGPSAPSGYSGVLERNGVYFAIPATIDVQSPAVQQAASACHLGGLGEGG